MTGGSSRNRPGSLIGSIVGNYELKATLGEGGMGTVYLAQHSVMGWPAAIKVLRRSLADDKVLVKRFINEARVIRAVRHPNIVEILDIGILPAPDDRPYLLMELLEGETLGQRLDRCGRLDVPAAIDLTCQTARALAVAHDKGITHRDLKPDNLFLVRDPDNPGRDKVKVLDFGIAKLRDRDGRTSAHTRSGVLLGTPAYMSPEQCRGLTDAVDHRADVYALSVILYQMLAGKVPFTSAGAGDVLIMHVNAEVPRIGRENPAVPGFVEAAILRGMAKPREDRFQSMNALADALGASQAATPATPLQPVPASARPEASPPSAAMTTPVSWSGSRGSTTWSTRRPSRRVLAAGLSAAIATVAIFVAGGVRMMRDRAGAPAEPGGSPVDLTRVPAAAPAVVPAIAPAVIAPANLPDAARPPTAPTGLPVSRASSSPSTTAPTASKPGRRAPAGSPVRATTPKAPANTPKPPPQTTHKAKPWL